MAQLFKLLVGYRDDHSNLPCELKEALSRGEIAYTKAQAIARLKDEQERKALLKAVLDEDLSLTQIRERIASQKGKSVENNEEPPPPEPYGESLCRREEVNNLGRPKEAKATEEAFGRTGSVDF